MRIMFVAILSMWSASASAQSPQQFDLVCEGTMSEYKDGAKSSDAPFRQVLHIDLLKGEFCAEDCTRIERLAKVDSLVITLADVKRDGGPSDTYRDLRSIDRTNGKYTIGYMNPGKLEWQTAEATCVPKPFTPFPATKF